MQAVQSNSQDDIQSNIQLDVNKQVIKQQLRQLLKEILAAARETHSANRPILIRQGLDRIQTYCKNVGKTFIFCELRITCNEYDLGGSQQHSATLFRGPSEDASVAICVTDRGSLLHRNDSFWTVYCDAGDVRCNLDTLMPKSLRCLRIPA